MKIDKTFTLAYPREAVWAGMSDVRLVAACLPGAAILEELEADRYKGRFSVRLGPLATAFEGEVTIDRRPQEWTATVSGKGADARSSSRASGAMTYRLDEEAGTTQVHVVSEINLAGTLAQFGKAAVIQDIANRITADFIRTFEQRLAASAASPVPMSVPTPAASVASPTPASLDAGGLLWSVLRARVLALFRRLFGSSSQAKS